MSLIHVVRVSGVAQLVYGDAAIDEEIGRAIREIIHEHGSILFVVEESPREGDTRRFKVAGFPQGNWTMAA